MSLRANAVCMAIHNFFPERSLLMDSHARVLARNDIGCLTCDVSRKQIPRLGRGGAKGAGAGCIKNVAKRKKQNYN